MKIKLSVMLIIAESIISDGIARLFAIIDGWGLLMADTDYLVMTMRFWGGKSAMVSSPG